MEIKYVVDKRELLIENIKSFLFENNEFSHGLRFVGWCGDEHGFMVADRDGNEYRIVIEEV